MHAVNPYQPPLNVKANVPPDSSPRFFGSLVPAVLAIGLTLFVWVVLVSTLDRLVARSHSMLMWSTTLFLASSLSILAVNRIWRSANHPLAFACVFAVFSVVFLVAEGDTSNGASHWNMVFVYGTLLVLPFVAFFLAWYGLQKHTVRRTRPTPDFNAREN